MDNLKKDPAEKFEVFDTEYEELELDYIEFATLPSETSRCDKLVALLSKAGDLGERAMREMRHKKITKHDELLDALRDWYEDEGELLEKKGKPLAGRRRVRPGAPLGADSR